MSKALATQSMLGILFVLYGLARGNLILLTEQSANTVFGSSGFMVRTGTVCVCFISKMAY